MTKTDPVGLYEQMSVYEKAAWTDGILYVAGMDEAGRGPLAGPVCAACVILDPDRPVPGVNDSKKLTPKKRAELVPQIKGNAVAFAVEMVDEKTIDEINILEATKLCMKKAVQGLKVRPELLLIDALTLPKLDIPQKGIIKGDSRSVSIAAASILAKETRDAYMRKMDELYPQYGFARHKGYGTAEHIAALRKYGPCPIHRRSFIGHFVSLPEEDR